MRRISSAAAALTCALSVPSPSMADVTVFAKVNAAAAEASRDESECRALANKTYYLGPRTSDPQYRIGGMVIMALALVYLDAQAKVQGVAICMRNRGYAKLILTDDEAHALQSLKTEAARDAWKDRFFSSDIASRVAAALTPKAPPLPSARDVRDGYVIRAVRIDPGSVALAAGPTRIRGDVITGKLQPRQTAVLQEDYRDSIALTAFGARAGTVFQEYFEPAPWDPTLSENQTAWCGMVGAPVPYCFRSTLEGYEISFGTGHAWMVGYTTGANAFTRPFLKPLNLIVQRGDPQDHLDFSMTVTQLNHDRITLTAAAKKGHDRVEFWTEVLKFDSAGVATLPFWDRTLTLSRTAEGVVARFEPRSDGNGWLDAPEPEPSGGG